MSITQKGFGTANGGMFSIDLADYYGLTAAGEKGYVSTWMVGRSFAGYTPFDTSYGIGVVPVEFTPGWEDARDDMSLYSAGANLQLLTSHAQLDTRDNVKLTADSAATDATVRWDITSDGVCVASGSMAHTGSGLYEADIRWPNVSGLCNFVVSATQNSASESASRVISFYPPNPDDGPYLVRKYPDREIDTNGGRELNFKVVAKTAYSTLDRVEWYYDGLIVSSQTTAFGSDEAYEGVATFAITPARQADDYRTSLRAKVYRKDGESDSLFWTISAVSNEEPVVTKVSPNTAETLVVPLGSGGSTTFIENVSDADDDSRELQWYINGELADDDAMGGDPACQESSTHTFTEVGDYTIEVYVKDERGNVTSTSWKLHAGVQLSGNTPSEGSIEPPDGLTWDATLRVGYRYDFDYECTDVDGNLAYAAVYVDNAQNWCPWYTGSDALWPYKDESLSGSADNASIYDIVFTSAGEHEIKLLVRDSAGEETTATKTVTVEEADAGSSVSPTFLKTYPANVTSFSVASLSNLDFQFLMKDPDADMEVLRTYVDGSLYEETSSNVGDTACDLEKTVENIPSGNHSVYFEMVDRAGNTARSTTYSVSAGSTGSHSPVFEDVAPTGDHVLYAGPTTTKIRLRIRGADPDGDIEYVRLFNTAGALSDIDGSESGQDYDKKTIDSDGVTYFSDTYLFNITQSGTLKVKIYDKAEHSVTKTWTVQKVAAFGTGSAPVIEFATINEGEECNIKYEGEVMAFYGFFTDPDGDLDRIEAWKDGIQVGTWTIGTDEGCATATLAPSDVRVDSSESDREKATPVVFKIIDKAGNITERNAYYSLGPWNHDPSYPDEAIVVQTTEDADVGIMPTIQDEDGDTITATVKTAPEHGVVSGSPEALRYTPIENYNGEDSLVLSCDDGYGGTGDLTIRITVQAMNDSPTVVNESGDPTKQIRVEVPPGTSYKLKDLLTGLALDAPDGSTAIDSASLTILSESDDLNRSGADNLTMISPGETLLKATAQCSTVVVTPTVFSETQFLSVAFLDDEGRPSTPLTVTFVAPTDTDGDGMADSWETSEFGNLTTANAETDYDGDGLLDINEYANGTDPRNKDSDGDGMWDGWEITYGLNPMANDAADDADGDGATNLQEFKSGTTPTDASSHPPRGVTPVLELLLN